MITRRQFLTGTVITAAGALSNWSLGGYSGVLKAFGAPAAPGLSNPTQQPLFSNSVPDALSPGFIYQPDKMGRYKIKIGTAIQQTGLIDPITNAKLSTPVWGYGDQKDKVITWPGRTFQINSVSAGGPPETEVFWQNALKGVQHLLPVDTSLHWAYSLPGYTGYSIATNGVPIITHLHGGHTDFQFDGNPEFFYNPYKDVVGPQWANVPGGFTAKFRYDNNVPAGNLWYHDHALGITRLNVYAGMAGFYFVRDDLDTGDESNAWELPVWPYEKAYAIQDRMFLSTGELFYPAFPGDPYYADFIDGEGAVLPPGLFPGGGPTALAEFFGDHMVVNGLIWPKEDVEPRNYRLHLLNGTDSRFMVIQFRPVPAGDTDLTNAGAPIQFHVIGSDQGLATEATPTTLLLSEPGSRYDIVVDFKGLQGQRIIMENIGGDVPFGGDYGDALGPDDFFPDRQTDRIMAFDVAEVDDVIDSFDSDTFATGYTGVPEAPNPRIRKVALFEGKDEFGRLQPLLGTAEPATDYLDNPISWPATPVYGDVGLVGPMEGSIAWHSPTTENPALGATEEWEVWNVTGDAHPVHLHLVHFEVLGRQEINWDSNVDEDGFIPDGGSPADDGIYLMPQPTVQHNSVADNPDTYGDGFKIVHPSNPDDAYGAVVPTPDGYVENTPKDMVTALPGQITRIRAIFDKPGRYVWHCHILSHEDHEMMRVLHVGAGA